MSRSRPVLTTVLTLGMILTVPGSSGLAQTRAPTGVDQDADAALAKLYETTPAAKMLSSETTGILIFPNIVKAGFLIGGQYGEGHCAKAATPSATTTSPLRRTACRPGPSRSGTRCSS